MTCFLVQNIKEKLYKLLESRALTPADKNCRILNKDCFIAVEFLGNVTKNPNSLKRVRDISRVPFPRTLSVTL